MNLKKVYDMAVDLQTEDLKKELYELVRTFVYKYHTRYFPHYKGDLDDLVGNYYAEFLTPKSRVKGQEKSLLDIYDPSVQTLPALVKVSVIRKMIDGERTYHPTLSFGNERDEETGDVAIDYLAEKIAPQSAEMFSLTEEEVKIAKEAFESLSPRLKLEFLKDFKKVLPDLEEESRMLFKEILGEHFPSEEVKDSSDPLSPLVDLIQTRYENLEVGLGRSSKEGKVIKVGTKEKGKVKDTLGEGYEAFLLFMSERGLFPFLTRGRFVYFTKNL